MTERVFVDSNVLVYARDASEPEKQPLAQAWLRHLWLSRSGCLSVQVLSEFYVTVTRKLKPGMDAVAARGDVEAFMAWNPLSIDSDLVLAAWRFEDRFSLSWWDALVVSAAVASGAKRLLTEDLQEGLELDGVLVVNPFRSAP